MYWSDCSVPATIQTARIEDGGDRQILVTDYQHSCIVDIAIDFNSTHLSLFLIILAKLQQQTGSTETRTVHTPAKARLTSVAIRTDPNPDPSVIRIAAKI